MPDPKPGTSLLSCLSHADQIAEILSVPDALKSAWGAYRRLQGGGGGQKRNPALPRCPVCAADTLTTIRTRRRCRGCKTTYLAALQMLGPQSDKNFNG